MVTRTKKISLCVLSFAISTAPALFGDITIGTIISDPIIIKERATTISFEGNGRVDYTSTNNNSSAVYIDQSQKDTAMMLDIGSSSSYVDPFADDPLFHVNTKGDAKNAYSIDLSNTKDPFTFNSSNIVFGVKSKVINVGNKSLSSAALHLTSSDNLIASFANTRVRFESVIEGIIKSTDTASKQLCSSVVVGIPVLNANGANNILLKKGTTNDGSVFVSSASATNFDSGYQFDEVNSTVFGCGKISTSGLAEGEECNQLCNFDLSNFDLSKDSATSTSPRYASVIGAARVSANDGAKNVTINQLNGIHIKNTPKTTTSIAGIENSNYNDSYAVVIGGGYIDTSLTYGADDNESCGIFQFNDVKIDTISGKLNANAVGSNDKNSAAVIGCAKLSTTVGDEGGGPIENSHVGQFNNISIGEISLQSGESTFFTSLNSSSNSYASVIGSANDELVIHQNATNSTIEEFNNLKIGIGENARISGELNATGNSDAAVIGSGYSEYTLNGSNSKIWRFNGMEISDIAEGAKLHSSSNNGCAVVIGSANEKSIIGAANSTIEEFNNLKVGNISNPLISSSSGDCATLIGSANTLATINKTATGSTINQFDNLEVGNISGSTDESSYGSYTAKSGYASIIGIANSELNLSGNSNNIKFFNNAKIGNITKGSFIKSEANEAKDVSISTVIGCANVSAVIDENNNESAVELFNGLEVKDISGTMCSGYYGGYNVYSKYASVIGIANSDFKLNGQENHINFFNDVSIGNVTSDSVIKAGANENKELSSSILIGSANISNTIDGDAKDSTIELFNDLNVGNISGKLDSGYDGGYNVKSKCASIIGAASSEFTMSGEDSHINFFNDVSIGNITSAALIDDFTHGKKAPIKSGASLYTTVIGDAHNSVTVDESANGSTINIFDNLKIGDISTYEINTGYNATYDIHSSNTSIFGTAFSKFVLNGKKSEINYFNGVSIGNIEGSTLKSGAEKCATIVGCAKVNIETDNNADESEINLFNNLVIGDASGVLKSEVVGLEYGYCSVIGCANFECNDTSKIKIFSNVSSQFHGNTVISSISKNDNLSLNTLGGCYNGYYGGEENNIADGMRFYFYGIDNSNSNIVVAALEQNGSNYFLKNNCRAFSIGPNFQINVGRERLLEGNLFGFETEDSVINGGVKSANAAGVLHILGDVGKAPYNDSCENSIMRIDGGWDAQCFGRISDLRNIDIIEGSLSLMGTSNSAKAELETAIKQVDEYGYFPNYEDRKPNGSLTLAEGQTLCFGVNSGKTDDAINSRFDSGETFKTVNGKLLIRNDGINDRNILSLKGGKLSVADTSSATVSSNSCFYVIRADVPHDENANGNLINIDPNFYNVSTEDFNADKILGNVSMYKITDSQDQSIVTGIKGALAKKELNAYKACDTDGKNIGIVISSCEDMPEPEPGPVPLHEDIIDVISGSNIGIVVAENVVDNISVITDVIFTHMINAGIDDYFFHEPDYIDIDDYFFHEPDYIDIDDYFFCRHDESYQWRIINKGQQVRYIGGRNYALSTQYKNRYSLNPKLFFSPFGEHGHQDKVSDLGYDYNLYGFTAGCSISKYLQSEARISVGIFGSFSGNTTKFCGEKSRLGMRNNQKMYFGGIFGSYEDHDISDLRTNLSAIVGGGRFKNKTLTRITDGGKVRAKFNSSDFHASADFVKNMINIGNSGFHCGPWMALSYNHIHENGHNVVCNGENIANVSSTRFDFLDTTLGINFEKNISYGPERNISGRIFAKAGWFCRPVRSHSSCTIRADGVDPVNSEFRFSDRNAAIVSGGFKFEFNKKWELSAGVTSRIAKYHWLINGNAVVGYSF